MRFSWLFTQVLKTLRQTQESYVYQGSPSKWVNTDENTTSHMKVCRWIVYNLGRLWSFYISNGVFIVWQYLCSLMDKIFNMCKGFHHIRRMIQSVEQLYSLSCFLIQQEYLFNSPYPSFYSSFQALWHLPCSRQEWMQPSPPFHVQLQALAWATSRLTAFLLQFEKVSIWFIRTIGNTICLVFLGFALMISRWVSCKFWLKLIHIKRDITFHAISLIARKQKKWG